MNQIYRHTYARVQNSYVPEKQFLPKWDSFKVPGLSMKQKTVLMIPQKYLTSDQILEKSNCLTLKKTIQSP